MFAIFFLNSPKKKIRRKIGNKRKERNAKNAISTSVINGHKYMINQIFYVIPYSTAYLTQIQFDKVSFHSFELKAHLWSIRVFRLLFIASSFSFWMLVLFFNLYDPLPNTSRTIFFPGHHTYDKWHHFITTKNIYTVSFHKIHNFQLSTYPKCFLIYPNSSYLLSLSLISIL